MNFETRDRIYVSNICYRMNEEDLLDYFSRAGFIKNILLYRGNFPDCRSLGRCIIRYADMQQAKNAVRLFNQCELNVRILNVKMDDEPLRPALFKYKIQRQNQLPKPRVIYIFLN